MFDIPKNEILESRIVVASYELDSFGHVNNAVFLNYLEKARGDFMTLKGLRFDDFFKWRRYPVVGRASMEFKYPAKAGDKLLVKGVITKHTAASFTLRYEVINEENQKLYDRMIDTMLNKLGYCKTCAQKTIEYFCTQTDEK